MWSRDLITVFSVLYILSANKAAHCSCSKESAAASSLTASIYLYCYWLVNLSFCWQVALNYFYGTCTDWPTLCIHFAHERILYGGLSLLDHLIGWINWHLIGSMKMNLFISLGAVWMCYFLANVIFIACSGSILKPCKVSLPTEACAASWNSTKAISCRPGTNRTSR